MSNPSSTEAALAACGAACHDNVTLNEIERAVHQYAIDLIQKCVNDAKRDDDANEVVVDADAVICALQHGDPAILARCVDVMSHPLF